MAVPCLMPLLSLRHSPFRRLHVMAVPHPPHAALTSNSSGSGSRRGGLLCQGSHYWGNSPTTPQSATMTSAAVLPLLAPRASIALTTEKPSITCTGMKAGGGLQLEEPACGLRDADCGQRGTPCHRLLGKLGPELVDVSSRCNCQGPQMACIAGTHGMSAPHAAPLWRTHLAKHRVLAAAGGRRRKEGGRSCQSSCGGGAEPAQGWLRGLGRWHGRLKGPTLT